MTAGDIDSETLTGQSAIILPDDLREAHLLAGNDEFMRKAGQAQVILGVNAVLGSFGSGMSTEQAIDLRAQLDEKSTAELTRLVDAAGVMAGFFVAREVSDSEALAKPTGLHAIEGPSAEPDETAPVGEDMPDEPTPVVDEAPVPEVKLNIDPDETLKRKQRALVTLYGEAKAKDLAKQGEDKIWERIQLTVDNFISGADQASKANLEARRDEVYDYLRGMSRQDIAQKYGRPTATAVQVSQSVFLRRIADSLEKGSSGETESSPPSPSPETSETPAPTTGPEVKDEREPIERLRTPLNQVADILSMNAGRRRKLMRRLNEEDPEKHLDREVKEFLTAIGTKYTRLIERESLEFNTLEKQVFDRLTGLYGDLPGMPQPLEMVKGKMRDELELSGKSITDVMISGFNKIVTTEEAVRDRKRAEAAASNLR